MIILARMEETGLRKTGKFITRDRNQFPETESFREPHAILFCRKELKGDLERAIKFAEDNGYIVFKNFPKGTRVDKAIQMAKDKVVLNA